MVATVPSIAAWRARRPARAEARHRP